MEGRFTTAILHDLPIGVDSDYYRVMGGGVMAFLDSPLLGIGTANYRDLCPDILAEGSAFRCDNHPHNFYIQMLAETGILGFAAGSVYDFCYGNHFVSCGARQQPECCRGNCLYCAAWVVFPATIDS